MGYHILNALAWPLGKLPLGFHRAAGKVIGAVVGKVFRYRRDVVMTNLSRSFPDRKYDELKKLSSLAYARFATVFCEALWLRGSSIDRIRKSHIVEVENVEELNRVYDTFPGVMLLLGHTGNWEILGAIKSYCYGDEGLHCPENDLCIAYLRLSNPSWDRFIYTNRLSPVADKEHFDGIVESRNVIRYAIRHRDARKIYFFITDQSPYTASAGVPVSDFMHQRTVSMNGGPALARSLGFPVMYLSMRVKEDGNYVIRFIPVCDNASEMTDRQILDKYYGLLRDDLEAQPWNYLWTHKRWK